MSVTFTEVLEVKNSLLQQCIAVSDEWIEACIEFLKQEQGRDFSLQSLKKSVYQQWLVADLEEIACPSLPPQLPTQQKITLQNNFALQVQGIRDVSRPAYSQLKQLEGTQNSNAEYSSAPKTAIPEWEAKPTRMLMLNLTDGCIHIQGMEYQTINCISPNLHAGIKVLIKGPVDCRFGVLLLQPENIRILGGEVESKVVQYSRENILKTQLQIPIVEDNSEASVNYPNLISNGLELSNQTSTNTNRERFNYNSRNVSNENVQNQSSRRRSRTPNLATNINEQSFSNIPTSHQSALHEEILVDDDTLDLLDNFGDDDFEQNLDYSKIDEIENTQRQREEANVSHPPQNEPNIWEEDEDVVREMMEFQDQDLAFKIPFDVEGVSNEHCSLTVFQDKPPVFTYLSSISNMSSSNSLITIKGFIITVLSKLECTPNSGWNLLVKINDGTASIDVSIHDKVLEKIIGVSAQDMLKKKTLAVKDAKVKAEVLEAVSKCKHTLQDLNCLMDVKFTPGQKPSIMKFTQFTEKHLQQMIEIVHSFF